MFEPVTVPVAATLDGVIAPRLSVMAGVVVAVATVPEMPFAVVIEAVVTVPALPSKTPVVELSVRLPPIVIS